MTDKSMVTYYTSPRAEGAAVRMLVYQRAVQLYADGDFLAAFLLSGVRLLEKKPEGFLFSLAKDGQEMLLVPGGHFLLPELLKASGAGAQKPGAFWKKWKVPLFFLGLLLLLVAGYNVLIGGVASLGTQFVSPKKETALGQMMLTSILQEQKTDTLATRRINEFAADLMLSKQYKIHIYVVEAKEQNAFAIPGGFIVVYKPILTGMKGPEELAALLGHETAHIDERHTLKNFFQGATGALILNMVFGDMGSLAGAIAGRADWLRGLSYSRRLEEEADQLGMQKMIQNRLDPRGMIQLMQHLEKEEKSAGLPGFLSTHPVTADRKEAAEQFAGRHPVMGGPGPQLAIRFQKLQEALVPVNNQ